MLRRPKQGEALPVCLVCCGVACCPCPGWEGVQQPPCPTCLPLPCCHRACQPPPLLSLLRRDAWGALKRRLLTPLAAQRALALILPTMPAEDAGELLLAKRFLASVALG